MARREGSPADPRQSRGKAQGDLGVAQPGSRASGGKEGARVPSKRDAFWWVPLCLDMFSCLDSQVAAFFSHHCWFLGQSSWKKEQLAIQVLSFVTPFVFFFCQSIMAFEHEIHRLVNQPPLVSPPPKCQHLSKNRVLLSTTEPSKDLACAGGGLHFCIAKLGFVEACLGLEASLRATKYLLSLDRPCAALWGGD